MSGHETQTGLQDVRLLSSISGLFDDLGAKLSDVDRLVIGILVTKACDEWTEKFLSKIVSTAPKERTSQPA